MNSEDVSIWKALIKTPASIALIIYTFICVWFVGGLTVFHLYLISTNQSTYENFRYRYDRTENPYNRGVFENFKEVFWTSIPPSKNDFRAVVEKEPEILGRAPRGGFVNSHLEKTPSDVEMGNRSKGDEMSNHPRRSSWGRSENWELPSDVGSGYGSNRTLGGSSESLGGGTLTGQNRQS